MAQSKALWNAAIFYTMSCKQQITKIAKSFLVQIKQIISWELCFRNPKDTHCSCPQKQRTSPLFLTIINASFPTFFVWEPAWALKGKRKTSFPSVADSSCWCNCRRLKALGSKKNTYPVDAFCSPRFFLLFTFIFYFIFYVSLTHVTFSHPHADVPGW